MDNEAKKNDLKRIIHSLDDVLSEVRFLFEKYEIKPYHGISLIDEANDKIVEAMGALKTELFHNMKED